LLTFCTSAGLLVGACRDADTLRENDRQASSGNAGKSNKIWTERSGGATSWHNDQLAGKAGEDDTAAGSAGNDFGNGGTWNAIAGGRDSTTVGGRPETADGGIDTLQGGNASSGGRTVGSGGRAHGGTLTADGGSNLAGSTDSGVEDGAGGVSGNSNAYPSGGLAQTGGMDTNPQASAGQAGFGGIGEGGSFAVSGAPSDSSLGGNSGGGETAGGGSPGGTTGNAGDASGISAADGGTSGSYGGAGCHPVCIGDQICLSSSCVTSCTAPEIPCGIHCVNPETNPVHCGGCNLSCSNNHVSEPVCVDGLCVGECDAGWADCNDDKSTDGCENDLSPLACLRDCNTEACGYLDTDGDGLGDVWEDNGYVDVDCNGTYNVGIDTPLPDSNKSVPNIYVKWDHFVSSTPITGHSHEPSSYAIDMIEQVFLDHGVIFRVFPEADEIEEKRVVTIEQPPPECAQVSGVSLQTVKAAHLPSYLGSAYHYALFAHRNTCDDDITFGLSQLGGTDFVVSLGYLEDIGAPAPDTLVAAMFLHLLGHNLGLRNGGGDDIDGKPNYLSVMNEGYQWGIGLTWPGWWGTMNFNPAAGFRIDYSSFQTGTLDENALDETLGVQDVPDNIADIIRFISPNDADRWYAPSHGKIDWDGDHTWETNVFADINGDSELNVLEGYNDWEKTEVNGVTRLTHMSLDGFCTVENWVR
jgi:hypothetical protein